MSRRLVLLFAVWLTGSAVSATAVLSPVSPEGGPLIRMPYNRPGTSFLKVGLWCWPMPMDFNRDGIVDLVVSCPDLPTMGVFVFEGTREGVFRPGFRIARPGIWCVLGSHVNGEPVVANAEGTWWNFREDGFARVERNFTRHEDVMKKEKYPSWHPESANRTTSWRYVDIDGDGREDRVVVRRTGVVWYRHLSGKGVLSRFGEERPLLTGDGRLLPAVPLASFADFDGDGDPDLVYTVRSDGLAYYENTGTSREPRFTPRGDIRMPDGELFRMDLCMHTPSPFDWDGDGYPDLIVGDEDGRVAFVRNTGVRDKMLVPVFAPPEYLRQQNHNLNFGCLCTPSAVDWDGDGDIDLLTGDSAGHVALIENLSGPGVESPAWAEPVLLACHGAGGIPAEAAVNTPIRIVAGKTGSIQGAGEEKWGYTAVSACDWDRDGLPDVLVGSVWGYVYWHRNIGTRNRPVLGPAQPIEVAWKGAPPRLAWGKNGPVGNGLMVPWRTTPLGYDWDDDGLTDLVTLDTEGYLSLYRRERRENGVVLLPPARVFVDEKTGLPIRPNAGTAGRSGRRKLCICDWNGDGRLDLFVNTGVWVGGGPSGGNVEYWRQTEYRDGIWRFRHEGRISPTRLEGHASAPTPVDFNADGIADLVVGAEDGFFYYLRNPRTDDLTR